MMRRTILLAPALVALAAPWTACTTNGAIECRVGADCASGACSAAGRCVTTSGAPDAGQLDGESPSEDGGVTPPSPDGATSVPDSPVVPGEDAGATCVPNGDGTITRDEVPMQVGLRATYLVADNATWDTTGTIGDAGTRSWDLTGSLAGDRSFLFTALTPSGTWWASSYPAATFAMQLEAAQTLLGVYQVSDEALSLLGIVSPTNAAPVTETTYATPIPTLQFPFSLGSTWTTTSNVSGTVSGVVFAAPYTEKYVTTVDAAGEMNTPFATFPVLRVRTLLTQTVGLVVNYTESFVWIAECFGPVAAASTASSQTMPTTTEFSSDAEVRRLSP
jgi:predicted small secreted protein